MKIELVIMALTMCHPNAEGCFTGIAVAESCIVALRKIKAEAPEGLEVRALDCRKYDPKDYPPIKAVPNESSSIPQRQT